MNALLHAEQSDGMVVERVLGPLLSARARMVLRQLGRRPGRAVLGVAGIMFAVAIVVMTGFFGDSIDELVDVQFFRRARDVFGIRERSRTALCPAQGRSSKKR